MSEVGEARSHSRHSGRVVHSSCQICWSRIAKNGRRVYTRYLALCRKHRSGARVDDGAFAAGVDESQGIVRWAVRNTCRYAGDGCSF